MEQTTNVRRETDPHVTTTEALIRCARAAESLNSIASLALAARLYVKAWEIEHASRAAETPAPSHAGLLEWAAAEQARREPEPALQPEAEPEPESEPAGDEP